MKRKRSPATRKLTLCRTQNTDLDQLIEERKQEKRKGLNEELQKKLRIIREGRTSWSVGNREPFPKGTFERLKSNDILGNVLEYLNDPADVTDVYFACGTFADILEERRMLMMLSKVLNVFKRNVNKAYEFKGRQAGNTCHQIWSTICLGVRGVCKAWKEAVDFHSDITNEEWLITTDWTIYDDHRTNVSDLKYSDSFNAATSSINSRGVTISPIRDVFLVVNDRISEQLYGKLKEFFKAHGASVRFLSFHYERRGNIAAGLYEKLHEALKYMKNLKILCVSFFNDDDDDTDDDEMPELGGAFQDHQLEINVYPLPALESLEHFSYNWQRKESAVTQILKKCVNLKSVKLIYTGPAEEETTEALMALNLERFEGLHSIFTSNQTTWPLKYLKLFPEGESEMYASVLFPAINRFWETLEDLHIWGRMIVDAGVTTVRLELPHLKTFSVDCISRGMLGFDNLLPLKSLEKIIVDTPRSLEYENRKALVKVKTYLESGEMHKSNVWQCFPNLMRFQIRLGSTYCRPTPP